MDTDDGEPVVRAGGVEHIEIGPFASRKPKPGKARRLLEAEPKLLAAGASGPEGVVSLLKHAQHGLIVSDQRFCRALRWPQSGRARGLCRGEPSVGSG